MDKQKIENKFIYFISLLGMVMILVLIAYFFFLRNVEVDIMDNAQYIYVGENGKCCGKRKAGGIESKNAGLFEFSQI